MGFIPAWAGQPVGATQYKGANRVHPRVGGAADLEGWRADPVSFDEAAEEARRQAHNERVASEVAQGARRSAQEALDAAQAAVTASQGRMPAEGVPGLAGVQWTSAGPRPRPTRRKLHTR